MPISLETLRAQLPGDARILDAGGWFDPNPCATHMVDLMPYETRRGILRPTPIPGELFDRQSWFQVNFLDPNLRLPFADVFFDFVVCTHTLEDLADPVPLLREIRRVARAGYFETPSRLYEQSVGIRDQVCGVPGQPHHHWIVEMDPDARHLTFFAKTDSLQDRPQSLVPFRHFRRLTTSEPTKAIAQLAWEGAYTWEFVRGEQASQKAAAFTQMLSVSSTDRICDPLQRLYRRLKYRRFGSNSAQTRAGWAKTIALSQPYSKIPLG